MSETLIFDYDGTLHNTLHIYEPAFRECYQALVDASILNPVEISAERILSWLGMSARDMWEDFAPELPGEIRHRAEQKLGDRMSELLHRHQAVWFPHAERVLDRLKESGYRMVILSNSQKKYGQEHWKEFHMERWFDHWYDCESYGYAPKTEIIKVIKQAYPGSLTVIGDRVLDLAAARAVGAAFIGCQYGFGTAQELAGADALIADIDELPELLNRSTGDTTWQQNFTQ